MTPRLRIAVAGAGIGGLAAAAVLRLAGHEIQLFDRFAAPQPLGSGLVVQPVGLRVLDWLGAGRAARALGQPIRCLTGVEPFRRTTALSVRYDAGAPGRQALGIHRASLFAALHGRVADLGIPLHLGAEVAGTALAPGGRRLLLAGGAAGPFDLIVDALGAHSPLSGLRARPLDYGALWTTLDWAPGAGLPADHLTQRYRDARQMMGVLPLGRLPGDPAPKAAFFWSLKAQDFEPWRAAPLAAWQAGMRALWPQAEPFIAQIRSHGQMIFARYAHGTLRRPWAEGLAHIGDAAHRTSPQLGQGANMALLDALALARALDLAPRDEALALYAAMRRGHLAVYQGLSRFLTPQYQSDSRALAVLRDRVFARIARLPPFPRILGAVAAGALVPPLSGEPHRGGLPVAPAWALG